MALTRSFLRGMGLTEEQVSAIVEAHGETVDALKEQRDGYKTDAEALAQTRKELEELKALSSGNTSDEWQERYESERQAFEKYKADQVAAQLKLDKENAYRSLLKEVGISDNRISSIIKVTDLEGVEVKDGKLENIEAIKESVKEEWKDFIVSERTEGAGTHNPPGNDGASVFKDMDLSQKMKFANENPTDPEVVEWLK